MNTTDHHIGKVRSGIGAHAVKAAAPATRVLVVEDERIVALDLADGLKHLGYEVVGMVANADDAISAARVHLPDVVLMDIHLDGATDGTVAGREILDQLHIPVVYLTAYAEPETLSRAEASRPYGYLLKPFELRELEACLRMAVARRQAEQAVEQAQERLQLALQAAQLDVWEWQPDGGLVHLSGELSQLNGGPPEPLHERWQTLLERVHVDDRAALQQAMERGVVDTTLRMFDEGGNVRWLECHARAAIGPAGQTDRVVGVLRDVTERQRNEQQLRQASAVFQTLAEAIVILDHDGQITSVNPAFTSLTGHGADAVLGRHPDDFLHLRRHSADFYAQLDSAPVDYWQGEIDIRRADSTVFPAWQHVCPVRDEGGQVTHYVLTFSDISMIRTAEAHIHHLAFHDALTGLGNRHMLRGRLEEELRRTGRTGNPLALLFVDLDNFKHVNDAYGHAAGDALISTIGQRIAAHLRSSDLAVRLGGDEFVVIAPDLPRTEDAALIAQKLLDDIHKPLLLKGESVQIGASIGIAIHPDDGEDVDALMQAADSAMYQAKGRGRHCYAYFSAEVAEATRERLTVEQGLRRALDRHEMQLEFLPMVDLARRQITGVEALVRWNHPQWGRVGPARFLRAAEDSGLVVPLGLWVLRNACLQATDWLDEGLAPALRLGVNVSVRQLQHGSFVDDLAAVLRETGFPPQSLELDITESALQAIPESRSLLGRLRHLGVKVAIDDFGAGFSSLALLRHLAIDRIKLDRSFVTDLPGTAPDTQIARAVVDLAAALQVQLTAEGVETEVQREALLDLGCHEGQGYLFGRPVPGAGLRALWADGGQLTALH